MKKQKKINMQQVGTPPEVNIRKTGHRNYAYIIEVQDSYVKLAVTKQELEKIVLYGQKILKDADM